MKKNLRKKKTLFIALAIVLLIAIFILFLLLGKVNYYTKDDQQLPNTLTYQYGQEMDYDQVYGQYQNGSINLNVTLKVTNTIQDKQLGKFTITYTPSFPFSIFRKTIEVEIIDTTAPVITLIDDPDYWIFKQEEYIEEGFTAIDNYDGDISDKVVVTDLHDGTISYCVVDSLNNKTEVIRKIKYKDSDAPVLTVSASYIAFQVNTSYSLPSYSAIDENEGDLTSKVIVENTINPNKVGNYYIKYTAKDRWDNTSEKIVNVYVYRDPKTSMTAQPGNKQIYLTFDDGPYKYTQDLLNILDKYHVKATFFVTYSHSSYAYMIKEEAKRGHSIGVHTYTHDYQTCYSSVEGFWNDINKMNDIIYQQTGKKANFLRFPGGASNTVSKRYCTGIMTTLANDTATKGFRYYDWNVSSGDAGGNTTADACFNELVKQTTNRTFSIVLQHDVKWYSLEATERYIQWALANGFTFYTITDSTPVSHHRIAN